MALLKFKQNDQNVFFTGVYRSFSGKIELGSLSITYILVVNAVLEGVYQSSPKRWRFLQNEYNVINSCITLVVYG